MASGALGTILGGFGGGVIGGAVVKLGLDDSSYKSGLAQSQASLGATGKGFDQFAAAGAAAFALVGAAAVKFAAASVGAALEAQAAQTELANSIENSKTVSDAAIPVFNEQAESIRRLTGADDEAITSAQAFLVQMKLTQSQVTSLTPLIVDLATKMNVDLNTAAKAVGKAVNGNIGGLSRMGVIVDETAAQTNAYAATLDALGVAQGFAAEKAKDEPWRRLSSTFEEVQEQVGQQILPALQELAEAMIPLAEDIGPLLEDVFARIAEAMQSVSVSARILEGDFSALTDVNFGLLGSIIEHIPGMQVFGQAIQDADTAVTDYRGSAKGATVSTRELTGANHSGHRTWIQLKSDLGSTNEKLQELRKATRETFTVTDDVLDKLADRSRVSAQQIVRAFRRQIEALSDYQKNLEDAKRKGASQALLDSVAELGLEGGVILAGLADASKREIGRANEAFEDLGKETGKTTASILDTKGALERIDGAKAKAEVEIHYSVTGVDPGSLPGLGR